MEQGEGKMEMPCGKFHIYEVVTYGVNVILAKISEDFYIKIDKADSKIYEVTQIIQNNQINFEKRRKKLDDYCIWVWGVLPICINKTVWYLC